MLVLMYFDIIIFCVLTYFWPLYFMYILLTLSYFLFSTLYLYKVRFLLLHWWGKKVWAWRHEWWNHCNPIATGWHFPFCATALTWFLRYVCIYIFLRYPCFWANFHRRQWISISLFYISIDISPSLPIEFYYIKRYFCIFTRFGDLFLLKLFLGVKWCAQRAHLWFLSPESLLVSLSSLSVLSLSLFCSYLSHSSSLQLTLAETTHTYTHPRQQLRTPPFLSPRCPSLSLRLCKSQHGKENSGEFLPYFPFWVSLQNTPNASPFIPIILFWPHGCVLDVKFHEETRRGDFPGFPARNRQLSSQFSGKPRRFGLRARYQSLRLVEYYNFSFCFTQFRWVLKKLYSFESYPVFGDLRGFRDVFRPNHGELDVVQGTILLVSLRIQLSFLPHLISLSSDKVMERLKFGWFSGLNSGLLLPLNPGDPQAVLSTGLQPVWAVSAQTPKGPQAVFLRPLLNPTRNHSFLFSLFYFLKLQKASVAILQLGPLVPFPSPLGTKPLGLYQPGLRPVL